MRDFVIILLIKYYIIFKIILVLILKKKVVVRCNIHVKDIYNNTWIKRLLLYLNEELAIFVVFLHSAYSTGFWCLQLKDIRHINQWNLYCDRWHLDFLDYVRTVSRPTQSHFRGGTEMPGWSLAVETNAPLWQLRIAKMENNTSVKF